LGIFKSEIRFKPSIKNFVNCLVKILFCVGKDSVNTMRAWPVINIVKQFGTEVLSVPGGYLGYLLQPNEFATDLINGLKKRNKL
jgi:hypothetical protein